MSKRSFDFMGLRIIGTFSRGCDAWASPGEMAPDNPPEPDCLEEIKVFYGGERLPERSE